MDFIFISIPKNASQSIRKALNYTSYNHVARHKIDKDAFSFAVVRHPLDRLASWYFWHKQAESKLIQYHCSFDSWIKNGCPHHWSKSLLKSSGITSPLTQWEFICDNNGDIIVDKVLRLESLQSDWKTIKTKLGISQDLPIIGKSIHKIWQSHFVNHTEKIAKHRLGKDFEILGYE